MDESLEVFLEAHGKPKHNVLESLMRTMIGDTLEGRAEFIPEILHELCAVSRKHLTFQSHEKERRKVADRRITQRERLS